jgi:hypothetical protein
LRSTLLPESTVQLAPEQLGLGDELEATIDPPAPGLALPVTVNRCTKLAVAALSAVTLSSVQGLAVPVHAPLQPVNR